jgi:hypothetical protein
LAISDFRIVRRVSLENIEKFVRAHFGVFLK